VRTTAAVALTSALLAVLGLAACSSSTDNAPCPRSCPATWMSIVLDVTAAGAVSGVVTICRWLSGLVTAGTYSLQVAATGFQIANLTRR
jgi:hypothetical protein